MGRGTASAVPGRAEAPVTPRTPAGGASFLRRGDPAAPSVAAVVLVIIGGGLGLVTSWLGGELVERLGVGIDSGANPNAPSSLTTKRVDRA
jgi:hypothetical protein